MATNQALVQRSKMGRNEMQGSIKAGAADRP